MQTNSYDGDFQKQDYLNLLWSTSLEFKIIVFSSSFSVNPHIYPLNKHFGVNILPHARTNRQLKCSLAFIDLLQTWLLEIWSNVHLCHNLRMKHFTLSLRKLLFGIFDKKLWCKWDILLLLSSWDLWIIMRFWTRCLIHANSAQSLSWSRDGSI